MQFEVCIVKIHIYLHVKIGHINIVSILKVMAVSTETKDLTTIRIVHVRHRFQNSKRSL